MAIYLGSNKVTGLSVPVGDMRASVYDPDGDGSVLKADVANTITAGSANPITNDLYLSKSLNATGEIITTDYLTTSSALRILNSSGDSSALFTIADQGTSATTYLGGKSGSSIILRVGSSSGITLDSSNNTTVHGTLTVSKAITANSSFSGKAISGSSITVTGDASVNRCFISAPSSVTNSANAYFASSGQLCKSSSLRAIKTDIEDVTEEEAILGYNLRPRAFKGKQEGLDNFRQYGFIAEEVEEVLPDLATHEEGKLQGVAYDRVCSILLKQNQMQKDEIEDLKTRIESLEKKLG